MPSTSEVLLAQWRGIERRLADLRPDSPDREWLLRERDRVRKEYEELVALVLDRHSPEDFAEPRGSS